VQFFKVQFYIKDGVIECGLVAFTKLRNKQRKHANVWWDCRSVNRQWPARRSADWTQLVCSCSGTGAIQSCTNQSHATQYINNYPGLSTCEKNDEQYLNARQQPWKTSNLRQPCFQCRWSSLLERPTRLSKVTRHFFWLF